MNDKNKKNYIEGIDDEFKDIASMLGTTDFSKRSNKEAVYNKILKNYEKSGNMKKSNILKKGVVAAVLMVIGTGAFVMQNSDAHKVFADVLNKVSLGHVTIIQDDISDEDSKVYDKNGNVVSKDVVEKGGIFYTKNGDSIKVQSKDEDNDADMLIVNDANKINDYTCFEVKLPSYLPKGYRFKQAEFTKDEKGNVKDSKYAELTFINETSGEEFYMQERLDCEETKFETGTDGKVEKIKINGVDAALSDDHNVDWIKDGRIHSLMGKKLSRDEVIKVAESIK